MKCKPFFLHISPKWLPFTRCKNTISGGGIRQLAREYADPGKLLRPILTLMASQMFGGSVAQTLPLAAGIQLIHDFSLIHD